MVVPVQRIPSEQASEIYRQWLVDTLHADEMRTVMANAAVCSSCWQMYTVEVSWIEHAGILYRNYLQDHNVARSLADDLNSLFSHTIE